MDINNFSNNSALELAVNNFNSSETLTEVETQIIFKLAYFGFEFSSDLNRLVGDENLFFAEFEKSMETLLEEYQGIIDKEDGETPKMAIINTVSFNLIGRNRPNVNPLPQNVASMDLGGGDRGR